MLTEKLAIDPFSITFVDGARNPNSQSTFTIEDIFSDNDKNKIGINNDDYNNEKSYYSLEVLKKIENGEFEYDKETLEKFDIIMQNLFKK